jgi:hypothetical protein
VIQFLDARLLEAKNFASFRVDARHNVPDGSIFAGSVHSLKDQKQCVPVRGIVKLLQGTQLRYMLFQQVPILVVRHNEVVHTCRPLAEFDFLSGFYPEILRIDFHLSFSRHGDVTGASAVRRPRGFSTGAG